MWRDSVISNFSICIDELFHHIIVLCTCIKVVFICLFWQALGSYSTGLMDIEDLKDIECHAIPGAGACGNSNNLKYIIPRVIAGS